MMRRIMFTILFLTCPFRMIISRFILTFLIFCLYFRLIYKKNALKMSFVGTWDLESSENFDEYMKELGRYI